MPVCRSISSENFPGSPISRRREGDAKKHEKEGRKLTPGQGGFVHGTLVSCSCTLGDNGIERLHHVDRKIGQGAVHLISHSLGSIEHSTKK